MSVKISCVSGVMAEQSDCDVTVSIINHPLANGERGLVFQDTTSASSWEKALISWGDAAICLDESQSWVIHIVWPRYCRDQDIAPLLVNSFRNCVLLAEKHGQTSIALPAWENSGPYRIPVYESSLLTIETLRACLPDLKFLKEIRLVCPEESLRLSYQLALDNL